MKRSSRPPFSSSTAVRNSLKFSLELEGFSVRTFADGPELLGPGDLTRPSCLVIDFQMPKMNGLELLGQLRRHSVSAPAILITGSANTTLRALAARAGVCIIEKPLLTALTEEIRKACRIPVVPS